MATNWRFANKYHLHLKFSKTGLPFVAYVDNFKKVRVKKHENSIWEDLGVLGAIPFNGKMQPGQYVCSFQLRSLFFYLSDSDVPYVVFNQTTRVKTKTQHGDTAYEQLFVY